ncbi:MAG: HAMP domain-containing sensor histidine kinase [Rickettsiales bacterium]
MLKKLALFCTKRVVNYGQQYLYFGLFGIINYPLAYIFRTFYEGVPEKENLFLRASATILCIPLIFHKFIPRKLKKYLPLYWYFVITYSLPFLCTYLLLQNHFSEEWIINFGVGLFIVILLIDWFMFIISISLGVVFGASAYLMTHQFESLYIPPELQHIGLYLYTCIFIVGSLFSKNKQQYHIDVIKQKNKLNLELSALLENKSKQLVQSMGTNRHFVRNISHELRTPVHSILGLAEQLSHNYESLTKQRIKAVLSMIYASAYNLSEMVNNLIDFSSYRQKNIQFHFKENNFRKLIDQCIETNNIYLISTQKQIRIELLYDRKVPEIFDFDLIRMHQVINNLLSNAIKYSDEKSRVITIRVGRDGKEMVMVSVEDEGMGIPFGEEEVIFNAFIRSTNTKNSNNGKGLGLAIIKEIIVGHKGKVWAYNNEKGATFSFVIPRVQEKEKDEQEK